MNSKPSQVAFLVLIIYFCGATLVADCTEANKPVSNGSINAHSADLPRNQLFCETFAPVRGIKLPHMVPLQPPPPAIGDDRWFHFMATITSTLELSDEQVEQIANTKRAFLDKCGPIDLKLHSLEHELTSALLEPDVNVEQITQLRKQLSTEKQALDDATTDQLIRVAKLLTPDQRRKVKLAIAKREILPLGCPPPPFFLHP